MLQGLKAILPSRYFRNRPVPFPVLFKKFQSILERNNRILELIADMGDKLSGDYVFDRQYMLDASDRLGDLVFKLISDLSVLNQRKNVDLFMACERIQHQIQEELAGRHEFPEGRLVIPLFEFEQDLAELDGGKMAVLSETHRKLSVPTPDGFVITTKAFFEFMNHNGLLEQVEKGMARWDRRDEAFLKTFSEEIQQRILSAELPRALIAQIHARLDGLQQRRPHQPLTVALRSSAWGEDGEASFAGQYTSMLNVRREQVVAAYRQVVASMYSFEAWRYRLNRDYREHEIAMAVGCQVMAGGAVSGVLHSYVQGAGDAVMMVSATWGLGAPVVGGEVATDTFSVERTPPYGIRSMELVDKPRKLTLAPGGGTAWEDVPIELRQAPSLTPHQITQLAQGAMTIERYYKRPQDIEWTFDADGTLYILQARPLQVWSAQDGPGLPVDDATRRAEVVFAGRGMVAQRGVAVGKVVRVDSDADLDAFPDGGILVSRFTTPRFARVMRKAHGIITDVGTPTGHMATIAREYRVPAVVNTEVATRLLHDGEEITLDASQNVVYRGRIGELNRFEITEEMVFEESYEYRLLRRLLKRISPLNLMDPHAENFRPSACRTYHDITRYIHEKAVEGLISLSENQETHRLSAPKRLCTEVPLGLVVIDAGGGTDSPPEAKTLTRDQILSLPLQELLRGIDAPGMWCTHPVSVDMGNLMASVARTFCSSLSEPERIGRNLAVILKPYMNLHLRLGYHFSIIDAYLSETINDNYIYFRFLGGVTDFTHRSRRAQFIGTILERFDFRVEVHGDLVVGRIKKLSLQRMAARMRVLGCLIGYTRQLDAQMHSDGHIGQHVDLFMSMIAKDIGGPND
jgi:pyruvate,water dikinase